FAARKRALKKELFRVVGEQTGHLFDEDTLTIVWARRFAAYKRPALITENPAMFERMLQRTNRPVQMIWAGKPFPTDFKAVEIFNNLNKLSNKFPRCAVLTGYELALSRLLKNGSDLWLNNPVVTREASGTSGMSATMNGSITISTNDGWVREFERDGENCFIIPEAKIGLGVEARDRSDRDNFYAVLESKVLPLYYDNREAWLDLVFNAMNDICPAFDSDRMADEYYTKMYNA
ncbi:MAG: alpha-glucan family phosphorylase, partial [Akkermansia sp.]